MRKILVPVLCSLLATFAFAQEKKEGEKDKKAVARALFEDAQASLQEGNMDAAVAGFRKATEADPKFGQAWHMLGYTLHAQGKLDDALPIHLKAAEFREVAPTATYNVACVHALKGDKDKAIEWLGKAMEAGFARASHIENDTDFDSMRSDPRFKDLVKKMAAAEASSDGGGGGGAPFVHAPVNERKSARVALFTNRGGSPAQITIDFGPVKWKDKYDELVGSEKTAGKAWRFGSEFWTTLDNSVAMTIGGTSIPAGYWYLTLTNVEGTKFTLGVHDANEVKKQRLDAYQASKLQGGTQAPLGYEKVEDKADNLSIKFDMTSAKEGSLAIHFGGHKLTAPVQLQLEQ